ncbi:YegP family protein [Jejudonia soesokkakensis]|uniref:YegP family protein n=1 Tax=Jejudonia soesokkakensis TaxID=1323432 RepID=A0ABW2MTZ0_9FLAO
MFELKKKGEQYHFVLKAGNGQVILSSEMYNSKASAKNGIASVQKNCSNENLFERKTAKNGKFHFNLKSTNGQIVGSSQMYAAESGMNNGIESVRKNAPGAEIKEI